MAAKRNPTRRDMTGFRSGMLTAIRRSNSIPSNRYWLCECDCGGVAIVCDSSLISGCSQSCGCLRHKKLVHRNTTHGMTRTPEYRIWSGIKCRCYNSTVVSHRYYGARGIKVCDRWLNSFENFYADMGPRPSPGHSVDRIDVNGNYCPENCRWATLLEQANNKPSLTRITIDGQTKTLTQWSRESGLNKTTIEGRIAAGWPENKLLAPKGTRVAPRHRHEAAAP